MITVSVPGKVILMGEHAVVYGKPALVAAINLRMKTSLSPNDGEGIVVERSGDDAYVRSIITRLSSELHLQSAPSIRVQIDSSLPVGYHLGTSAAVAVSLTAAFIYYVKKLWNPTHINQLAYELEKEKHGSPSGVDNSSVTHGGLIWYRKELEVLKSIWQLPFPIHKNIGSFYLLDTGKPEETTGQMVSFVRERYDEHTARMKQVFDQNELQVKRIAMALKDGDNPELISAIRQGQRTLEQMGVVSPQAKRIIRHLESVGAGAKILGGGGRRSGVGYILCYHADPKVLISQANVLKREVIPIQLGEEGIRLETKE